MKKLLALSIVLALTGGSLSSAFAAQKIVIGGTCSKAGEVKTSGTSKLVCTKSGKKMTWKASAQPTAIAPKEPTSFDDLYANRAGVGYAAWRKVSESIKANSSKLGALTVKTGPHTKPFFDKYPDVLALVSQAFPGSAEAKEVVVIRYAYKDLDWADKELRMIISAQDYDQLNRNEGGRLLTSNCEDSSSTCRGSKQNTTESGVALILQGIPEAIDRGDLTAPARYSTGMLEAHEYFHSLQRIPMVGKPLGREDWPLGWIREGSAEWVQNVVVNNTSFENYRNFVKIDCSSPARNLSESDIKGFFGAKSDDENNLKYDQFLNYCLGAYAIETLVAVKGQQSIIDLYGQMATRIGFEAAFNSVFGVEWKVALPILAKTVYANIKGL
jgi:hypothetical protein